MKASFSIFVLLVMVGAVLGDDSQPDFHDWTARIGYTRFGVRGDSDVSCIMYGSGCIWTPVSSWTLVAITSLFILGISGIIWRCTRRNDAAA